MHAHSPPPTRGNTHTHKNTRARVWCDAMRCDVMWCGCGLMSGVLMCNAMWRVMLSGLRCGVKHIFHSQIIAHILPAPSFVHKICKGIHKESVDFGHTHTQTHTGVYLSPEDYYRSRQKLSLGTMNMFKSEVFLDVGFILLMLFVEVVYEINRRKLIVTSLSVWFLMTEDHFAYVIILLM